MHTNRNIVIVISHLWSFYVRTTYGRSLLKLPPRVKVVVAPLRVTREVDLLARRRRRRETRKIRKVPRR